MAAKLSMGSGFDFSQLQYALNKARLRSVVVITSPSHGEGPGFEPQRNHQAPLFAPSSLASLLFFNTQANKGHST